MPHRAGTTAQRVHIGLTGLAFVFLLVLLGVIINRSARDNTPPTPAEQNAAMNMPSEPLAELGVTPGGDKNELAPANNSSGT